MSGSVSKSSSSRSSATTRRSSTANRSQATNRTQKATQAKQAKPATQTKLPEKGPVPATKPDRSTISEEASAAANKPAEAKGQTPDFKSWAGGDAAKAIGDKTMKMGSKGDDVLAMQREFNQKTGGKLKEDGIYGKDTQKAIRDFQSKNDLKSDGIFGKDTRGKLLGGEQKAADAKTADKPADAKPADKPVDAKPADKPADAKPADKPVDAKPADKPVDAKPADKPADAKQADGEKAIPGTTDTAWTDKLPPNLKKHAQDYIDAGKAHKVDPRFLAAISMQETGGGTSSAFRNKNNAMGIMGKRGTRSFKDVRSSIMSQAKSLQNNPAYAGKTTAAQIQKSYAPIKAANDPNNLNSHWLPNISKNMRTLGADPAAQVNFR